MKTINEVSIISGISKRTLHYYDEIGLLKPLRVKENGYRLYGEKDLIKLQQILLFRELNFSLNEIKALLNDKNFNNLKTFKKHKETLVEKRNRLNEIIELVEKRIKGEKEMSFKEFDKSEIEKIKGEYAKETEQKWGYSKAFKQSQKRTSNYTEEDWKKINGERKAIFEGFNALMNEPRNSDKAKEMVVEWKNHITNYFYECSDEILRGLAEMYINDERFKNNIDKHGEGTADFMSKAIKNYCEQKINNSVK